MINVPADQATIQAAVNAAVSGDTINVAAGTYDEQVVIDGKNLTLQGVGDTTIIMPSSESILATFYTYPLGVLSGWEGLKLASPILVKNAQNVTVKTATTATKDVIVVTGLRKGATVKPSATATAAPTSTSASTATASPTASPTATP